MNIRTRIHEYQLIDRNENVIAFDSAGSARIVGFKSKRYDSACFGSMRFVCRVQRKTIRTKCSEPSNPVTGCDRTGDDTVKIYGSGFTHMNIRTSIYDDRVVTNVCAIL